MRHIVRRLWLFLVAVVMPAGLLGAPSKLRPGSSETSISLPVGTVEGRLENGLRYLILPNAAPKHNVEVRLVMRVGSLMENERQKGAAHFLEHSAFIGTQHFPGRSMVDYFERLGMKFGRDINAFTGFDRTIYWLSVPMEKTADGVLDTTFLAIKDWLCGIAFEPERVKKERGVILEELRGYSTGDDFYGLKIGRGRYGRRMPLGNEDDIDRIDSATLRDFYRQWYVPQLATVVIVGNVDAAATLQKLRRCLSSVPSGLLKTAPVYPLHYGKGVQWQVVNDSLQRGCKLEIIVPHPTTVENSIEKAIEKQCSDVLSICLSNRLRAMKTDCDVTDQWYLADKNHFVMVFSAPDQRQLLQRITAVSAEMKRVLASGFCPGELEMAIHSRLQRLESDTTQRLSADLCEDLIDYITAGDRHLSSPKNVAAVRKGLLATTNRQLQSRLKSLLRCLQNTCLLAYTCSDVSQKDGLTAADVQQAWRKGQTRELQKYVFHAVKNEELPVEIPSCIAQKHAPADEEVIHRTVYTDLDVQELRLRNGITLLVRPTKEEEKTIFLTAIGRGGTADLSPEEAKRYHDAVSYVDMNSLERVPADTLLAVMSRLQLSMAVGEDRYWHQVLASAPAENAQQLFNLVYEKMCHPGTHLTDFEEARQAESESIGKQTLLERMMLHDADRLIANRIDSLVGDIDGPTAVPLSSKDIDELCLDTLTSYYRRLFADPSQLTLILTGNFNAAHVVPIAVATFARMKPLPDAFCFSEVPFQPNSAPYTETFYDENDERLVLNYVFAGHYAPSLRSSLQLKLMRDLLQDRLLSVLREQENIVYSPYADLYYSGCPQQKFHFRLTVSVKPDNRERAETLLHAIVTDLQCHPVPMAELEKMKRSFIVTKRRMLSDKSPSEWKTTLTSLVRNGEQLADFDHYTACLNAITPEEVRRAFAEKLRWESRILLYKTKK